MDYKYDAVLSDWRSADPFEEHRLWGKVWQDRGRRFTEGEPIVTSPVVKFVRDQGRLMAVTRTGTVYLLV
jgi:hypothetical protein